MKPNDRWTTAQRLSLSSGVLVALLVITGVVFWTQLRTVERDLTRITAVEAPLNLAAHDMELDIVGATLGLMRYRQTGQEEGRQRFLHFAAAYERARAQYDRLATSAEKRALAEQLDKLYREYKPLAESLLAPGGANRAPAAQEQTQLARLFELRDVFHALLENKIQRLSQSDLQAAHREAHGAINAILVALAVLLVIGLGVGVSTAFVTGRRVVQTEETLRVTLASIGDAVLTTDTAGRVTFLNSMAETLTGWTVAEARGRPLEECVRMVNEGTRAPVEQPVRKVLELGKVVGLANHTVLLAKDGTERPINDSAAPIRDEQGKALGVIMVFRDVTEEKKAEQGLRASEERYRTLFASAPMAVFVCNRDAVIQHFNRRAVELWGREPACGVEQHCGSVKLWLPNGALLPHAQSPMVEVLRTGLPALNVEVFIERPDGSRLPVLVNFAALKNEQGEITGAITSFVDITERKRAEDALRASEARKSAILTSALDCIISMDHEGRIVDFNPAAQRTFGYRSEEVVGRTVAETIVPPELREAHRRGLARFMSTGEGPVLGKRIEITAQRADDGQFPCELAISTTRLEGAPPFFTAYLRDITERKQAEEALRQQREWFEVTLSSIGDAVITVSVDGQVTFLNPVAETMTGWGRSEAIGRPLEMVFHIINEQTRQPVAHPIAEALREGVVVGLANHTVLIGKDGKETAIEDSAAPIRNAEGKIIGAVMVFHDVTQRRVDLEALRQSEERYRSLFASAPMAVFSCDPNGVLQHYNQGAVELWGREPARGIERYSGAIKLRLPDGAFLPREQSPIVEVLRTGLPALNVEVCIERPDGSRLPVLANFAALKNQRGEISGAIASFMDITERKRAEESVRAAGERLRFMAESMPQKIFTAKPNGDVDYFNRQWSEFTGLTFEQIRDWGWLQFIHPEDREENIRRWKQSIDTGEYFQLEHRFRRHDGVYVWHLSRAHAMYDAQGNILMWIGSNTNIDDQKQAEETLERTVAERTAELQATNEQLETLVYSIAHDLRSPLRAVTGFSEVLLEEHAASLDDSAQSLVKRIQTSSRFMDRLLLDLLAYGRASRAELELGPVEVRQAWEAALFQNVTQAEQTKACLECLEPLPLVRAHAATLGQCLANLISNALKFVPPGVPPHIRFWAEEIAPVESASDGQIVRPPSASSPSNGERDGVNGPPSARVRLWLEDNGIGIPAEVHERLFRVFERLHGTRYEGTGIGLSIVRKGIERMGGAVGLKSEPGKGSRFWIELAKAK